MVEFNWESHVSMVDLQKIFSEVPQINLQLNPKGLELLQNIGEPNMKSKTGVFNMFTSLFAWPVILKGLFRRVYTTFYCISIA